MEGGWDVGAMDLSAFMVPVAPLVSTDSLPPQRTFIYDAQAFRCHV